MRRIAALVVLCVGCTRRGGEPRAAPDPSVSASSSASVSPPMPPEVTRVHGDVVGRFSLRDTDVVVGEPIVLALEATPTKAPMDVFVFDEDRRSSVHPSPPARSSFSLDRFAESFPTRITLTAWDANGTLVCDDVHGSVNFRPRPVDVTRTVPVGTALRETVLLNLVCPAFARPGDYRLKAHRRFGPAGVLKREKITGVGDLGPWTTYEYSCDQALMEEGQAIDAACASQLDALPSITTELSLHVAPFDAQRLRNGTEARLRESASDVTRARVEYWSCGWISCGLDSCLEVAGGKLLADTDVIDALPSTLPRKFPSTCY